MKNLLVMRKSFIFSMVALSFLLFSTNAFASFPVKKSTNTETSVAVDADNNANSADDIAVVGSDKSQVTALLLVIFLGILGVHRFYLGYTWQGVVQLLTLGGFGVWALIDLIRIITGDLQPKNGSYSKTL